MSPRSGCFACVIGLMQLAAVGGCGSSTEVFAITMLTPTGQNQGEFYTPTMVTEGKPEAS